MPRQAYYESASLARRAFNRYGASVVLHDLLYYSQAEAAATLRTGPGLVNSVEAVEYVLLLNYGDTDSTILHLKDKLSALGLSGNLHRTPGMVILNGIVNQIDDSLLDEHGISRHEHFLGYPL